MLLALLRNKLGESCKLTPRAFFENSRGVLFRYYAKAYSEA